MMDVCDGDGDDEGDGENCDDVDLSRMVPFWSKQAEVN
jgi:hypothetical protein